MKFNNIVFNAATCGANIAATIYALGEGKFVVAVISALVALVCCYATHKSCQQFRRWMDVAARMRCDFDGNSKMLGATISVELDPINKPGVYTPIAEVSAADVNLPQITASKVQ